MEDPDIRRRISPGFYFQRCLALWGRERDSWQIVGKEKAAAVAPLEGRKGPAITGDAELHAALLLRQKATFDVLKDRFDGMWWRLLSLTPFVTGIGQPHPLENGFAFLKPYGLPYLAGSGVKGAVRAACREAWGERHAGDEKKVGELTKHYFGSEGKKQEPGREENHVRGALIFLDMLPEPLADGTKPMYRLDLVNPHYADYYGGKGAVPADWHSPVPSYFLTLRDGLAWTLRVIYAPLSPEDARLGWREEVGAGLERALTEGGLGAKKTWGYGLFTITSREGTPGAGAPASSPEARRAPPGSARTEPGPADRAAPAPARSAAARRAEDIIRTLRANGVKQRLSAIEDEVRRATPEERPALIQMLEGRLREFGLRDKEIREVVERVRAVLQQSPPEGKADGGVRA